MVTTATVIPEGTGNVAILPGGHEKGMDLIRIVKNRENTWNLARKCVFLRSPPVCLQFF